MRPPWFIIGRTAKPSTRRRPISSALAVIATMLKSRTAAAWIAVRPPYPDELEWADDINTRAAKSLEELPLALPEIHATLKDIRVEESDPSASIARHLDANLGGLRSSHFALRKIACVVSFDDGGSIYPDGLLEAFTANQLGEAIDVAVSLAQIARPGSLGIGGGIVVVDGEVLAMVKRQWFLYGLHSGDNRASVWPPLQDIKLLEVCHWAKCLGAFSSSFADGRIQRAFAALCHALSLPSAQSGEILFRAMQGLEAFYSDGIGDLRRQLSEKSQLWLGSTGQSANIVGHLYDLRSSYIHGSAKLSYPFNLHDGWNEDSKTNKRLTEGVEFAFRLLLATVQRCIRDGVSDLYWKYKYEVQDNAPANGG